MTTRLLRLCIGLAAIALMVPAPPAVFAQGGAQEKQVSLYDRLGGLAPISVVVDDFIEALVADGVLNANPAIAAARKRVPTPYLKYHVTALVCQATGGPCRYEGRTLLEAHAHLNITEREWDRMVTIFQQILAKHKVPAEETAELLGIVGSTKADIVVSKGGGGGEGQVSDPTSQVTQVLHAFEECWNRHDMDALSKLFARDAEFVNVVGMWWKGREEIRKAHERTHATLFKNSRLTFAGVSVRFPVEGLAIARSRWVLEGHVSPEGAPLPPRSGILLAVLAYGSGAWSIIDAQNTDIIEGVLSRPQ